VEGGLAKIFHFLGRRDSFQSGESINPYCDIKKDFRRRQFVMTGTVIATEAPAQDVKLIFGRYIG
jgi:hypothetical protein